MNTFTTPKGTTLPLVSLKGKDYLQVAHRLVWLTEVAERFAITTEFLNITDDQTVARALVTIYGEDGKVIRTATATKRETKKDFSDHTEKAETGAIGRALAMLGLGTQFAVADLDEGDRLADAPVVNLKAVASAPVAVSIPVAATGTDGVDVAPAKARGFRKVASAAIAPAAPVASSGVDSNDLGL